MSQEDIETLREGYAAASRRDWDRCLRFMHPDIEWVTQRTGTYHRKLGSQAVDGGDGAPV